VPAQKRRDLIYRAAVHLKRASGASFNTLINAQRYTFLSFRAREKEGERKGGEETRAGNGDVIPTFPPAPGRNGIADRGWNGGGTGDEIAICADTRARNLHPDPARGARSGMSVMLITVIGFGCEMGY